MVDNEHMPKVSNELVQAQELLDKLTNDSVLRKNVKAHIDNICCDADENLRKMVLSRT